MLAKILAVVLLAEAAFCQENVDTVRRLRFRRPRPKLIDVDNPDGDLRGSPVELRLAESELSAAIAEEDADLQFARQSGSQNPLNFRNQNSGNAALDALIATAQREKPALGPQPQVLEIEEIPTQRPLRLSSLNDQLVPIDEQPTRSQRVRNRGGVPARRRPRPDGEDEPRRRPNGPREEPVATLERYSHKNDDGSFTFGYVGADGSFREETRGADCITRGKYGYIDPDGVKREYTYTSGLPCEVGDDSLDLQQLDGDINVEDPVDPRERFRQTQNEQLTEAQIPQAARPRRPIQRRPIQEAEDTNDFSNFGGNAQRAQIPDRRPVVNRGNALQNLQSIADGNPSSQAAPVRPAPTRAPVRIAQRPVQASPRPAAPVNQGTFDFDAELEGFTLNRPSITFEQNSQNAPSSFQSQLSFNQNTGTFQTNLQQNVQGGQQITLSNNNAPSGVVTTASPNSVPLGTTFAATRASPRPTAVFQNSSPRPAPTSFPTRVNPSPSPQGSRGVLPAGTIQLGFEPLNIPDIAAVKVNLPPPTPAPVKIAPTQAPTRRPTQAPTLRPSPAPTQRPTPAPTQRPTPAPTQRPTPAPSTRPPVPVRITLTEAPRQSQPVRIASPTPAAPAPAAPSAPAAPAKTTPPANTFFVFQPFSQQGRPAPQPASAPFPTPVNPNAFEVRPAQPRPAQPRPVQPRPVQPQPPRPIQPQAARPVPQIPQRVPVPQAAAPQRTASPQLQFGFQPVSQGQPQPQRPLQPQPPRPVQQSRPPPSQFQLQAQRPQQAAPFTAFRGQSAQQFQARPQQLQARPAPPQQFQSRPTFQQPQLGIPPQLQQQQGAPQFAQFDSRFAPRPQGQAPGQAQFRPAQFQPGQSQQFSVFNPAQQLRGA